MWSTQYLYDYIHKEILIPIVHDVHHHKFCTGGLTDKEAMSLAASTWFGVRPVIHYSQDRRIEYNDPKIRAQAHSDSYWIPVDTHDLDVDVMLECKHKEIGLYKMRELLQQQQLRAA
jgi:UV DNA damage endonuclease